MYHMKVIAVFAFILVLANGQECQFTQALIQEDAMKCVAAHADAKFMVAVAKHMEDPSTMENPTFVCKYQSDLVNIVECMEGKLGKCIPEMFKPILEMFPSRERLADGIKFVCNNLNHVEDQCLQDNIMKVYTCYMGKVAKLQAAVSDITSSSGMKGLFCSVVKSEEKCFQENQGTCSKEYIEFIVELIEKFFPTSACPKVEVDDSLPEPGNNALANSLLGSLLIHGQPQNNGLRFKPYSVIKE